MYFSTGKTTAKTVHEKGHSLMPQKKTPGGKPPGATRGPKQKAELSCMAVLALLLVRTFGTKPTPAARAAIRAYYTWTADASWKPPTSTPIDQMVDTHEVGVLKALQRLSSGRSNVQPDIVKLLGVYHTSTGERLVGTPQELAQDVATFLPKK